MSKYSKRRVVFCHNTTKYLYLHYSSLIDRVCSLGYQVVCISPFDEFVPKLTRSGVIHVDWKLSQHGMNPFREVISLMHLYRCYRDYESDKVVTFSIKPNLYTALVRPNKQRIAHFCMITGLGYVFLGEGLLRKVLRRFISACYKRLFAVNVHAIFQNQTDRKLFADSGLISRQFTSVIHGTGIDTDYYQERSNYSKHNKVRFVFVGRLLADKGLNELLYAARNLDQSLCSVSIVGPFDDNPGGISPDVLQTAIEEGTINYVGEVTDVRPSLRDADIFVLPSYREGLSRSILEAMALGLGIITTDVPGCRELVENDVNGYIVPAKDQQSLIKAMQKIIDKPERIEPFGRKSRAIVMDTYEQAKVNDEIVDILGLSRC